MNFWEVFGVGVFVGIALGIWIAYFLIQIGAWWRNHKKNTTINPI